MKSKKSSNKGKMPTMWTKGNTTKMSANTNNVTQGDNPFGAGNHGGNTSQK